MTDDPDPLYEILLRARPGELGPDVVAELLRRPEWQADAACRGAGTERFFPDKGESLDPARAYCSACKVGDECRQAGDGEHGVWAGTSLRQRTEQRRVIRSSGRRPDPSDGEAARSAEFAGVRQTVTPHGYVRG